MSKNPIIQEFRISHDSFDVWGDALNWHFGICDYMTAYGYPIPQEWEFQAGMGWGVPEPGENYVFDFLEEILEDNEHHERIEILVNAGNILGRYSAMLDAAGLSY